MINFLLLRMYYSSIILKATIQKKKKKYYSISILDYLDINRVFYTTKHVFLAVARTGQGNLFT